MTALGQEPIRTTREIPGFVLNRLQGALLNEAFKLVQDGIVSVEDVDKTIREGLGPALGLHGTVRDDRPERARWALAIRIHRYGPDGINEMAQTQSEPREWDDETTGRIERQRRLLLPEDRLQARQAWRDRRLMALAAHKAQASKTITE